MVGSTEDVDARDNTGTTYTSGSSYKGVPIYWLNGNKVADQYQDFYDGSWDEEASMRTQAGTSTGSSPAPYGQAATHDGKEETDWDWQHQSCPGCRRESRIRGARQAELAGHQR